MMKGRLFIDCIDAYTEFGIYIVKGGWNELVAHPPLKACNSNDWQEYDGIDVDLETPVLDKREVSIKVAVKGGFEKFHKLISLLSSKVYHTFNCAYIKRIYKLRLVSVQNASIIETLGLAILKFADDFPMMDYNYIQPTNYITSDRSEHFFDKKPFSNYGIRILKGTLDEFLKPANIKTNLIQNIGTKAGAVYGECNVTYQSKDAKIYCLLRAETLEELWTNYDAFLYDFTKPDLRSLVFGNYVFGVYYKNCQVSEFYPDGKIWLQFTITVTVVEGVKGDMRYQRNNKTT